MKEPIKRLLALLLRFRRLRSWASRACQWYRHHYESGQTHRGLADDISETRPLRPLPSAATGERLNLLIPSLMEPHVFGGIATALKLFDAMAPAYENLRVIVLDSTAAPGDNIPPYREWTSIVGAEHDGDGKLVVECINRSTGIYVRANDHFIATAWWSAVIARQIVAWQRWQYACARRYVYLIQDYEPGFYPWSARYALAESTYRHPADIIAVFNTRILQEYFAREGYRFDLQHVFEPQLHPVLRQRRDHGPELPKERRILVYGRPSVERNAFPLIVAALRLWNRDYASSYSWQVVSAGEAHPPIPLGPEKALVSVGKLSIPEYASLLESAAIGISLMISPHPSYPPLEMAAFGVRVITNTYANKDLSQLHDGILSLSSLEPETIASQLTELCEAFEHAPWTNRHGKFVSPHYLQDDTPFPFAREIKGKFEA